MDKQPGSGDGRGERHIETWEDLIDDWDWLTDDDSEQAAAGAAGATTGAAHASSHEPRPLTDAECQALLQRFALADAVTPLGDAIRTVMNQPTMDFEWQYQACYPAFSHAAGTLDREMQRIDAGGAEFAPIAAALRAEVERQRGVVNEWFEEHTDRHRRFREAMVPVQQQMQRDNQRAAERQLELQRRTNGQIAEIHADLHRKRVDAFDDWNREWLRNHIR